MLIGTYSFGHIVIYCSSVIETNEVILKDCFLIHCGKIFACSQPGCRLGYYSWDKKKIGCLGFGNVRCGLVTPLQSLKMQVIKILFKTMQITKLARETDGDFFSDFSFSLFKLRVLEKLFPSVLLCTGSNGQVYIKLEVRKKCFTDTFLLFSTFYFWYIKLSSKQWNIAEIKSNLK